LVKKGVSIKQNLIDQKLKYYELKFSLKSFEKKINEVEKSWEKELKQITTFVPEFKAVKKEILENFGK
jgi:predicted phage-related endonuclease